MNIAPTIEPIQTHEINEILDIKWSVFRQYYTSKDICDKYTLANTDWNISIKLTYERKIIGMYLLKEEAVSEIVICEHISILYENINCYQNLRGIQGVTLGILDGYRGRGWGNFLKDYPGTLGYDYWWGIAFKTLGNLKDWQKRARLVGESRDLYLLLEDLRQLT